MVFYSSWVSEVLCLSCQRWTHLFWDLFNKQLMDVDTHLPLQLVTIWCLCWHCFESLIPGDLNIKSSNLFFLLFIIFNQGLLFPEVFLLLPLTTCFSNPTPPFQKWIKAVWAPPGWIKFFSFLAAFRNLFSLKVICILPNYCL